MRIVFLTPGSGDNFYCENCLRDKAAVLAMQSAGHDVMAVPLYLRPLLEDTTIDSQAKVFFGGLNVFLQQHIRLFRHTPRWMDKLFDSAAVLKFIGKKAGMTTPSELGKTTVSMLRGQQGRQAKELDRLVAYLRDNAPPDIVVLSNALLLGMAASLKETLGTQVVCMLQDEQDFVDSLPPDFCEEAWRLMREDAKVVDAFISPSRFYADVMRGRLEIPPARLSVIYNSIDPQGYVVAQQPPETPTLGYLSRQVPSKGLDLLAEAFIRLKGTEALSNLKLWVGGGKTSADESFIRRVRRSLARAGVSDDVQWPESFDRSDKRRMLPGLSVMCVPDRVGPAAGLFAIESLLAGVPVVEPDCGVFGELIETTGGGLLFEPGNIDDMTARLAELLTDPSRAHELGLAGRKAVLEKFTPGVVAAGTIELFEKLLDEAPSA